MAAAFRGKCSFALLTCCALLTGACGSVESENYPELQSSYSAPDPQLRAMAFIGDEYSTALDAGGPGSWATRAGKAMGYAPIVNADVGSGYVVSGTKGGTCAERVDDILATAPQIVVVACGMNDVAEQISEQAIEVATQEILQKIDRLIPRAKVVLVGPFADSVLVSPALKSANNVVAGVARQREITFVDPIDETWLAIGQERGQPQNILKLPGKNLLSPAGHREFARRFVEDITPFVPTYEPR